MATKSHNNQVQHSDEAHEDRYPEASGEGSNEGSSGSQEPTYFLPIPSRESQSAGEYRPIINLKRLNRFVEE